MMYAVIITDKNGSEEFERYYDKDHAEEIAHELTHQGDDTITAEIVEVEEKPKPKTKFELQDRYEPKRRCRINGDMDRTDCCEAEILYFESDYDEPHKGDYEGCECCGAMIVRGILAERPEPKPYTSKDIFRAMVETYQACAHDVLADADSWAGEAVFDFVVSVDGQYVFAVRWDRKRYEATDRDVIEKAIKNFDAQYNRFAD